MTEIKLKIRVDGDPCLRKKSLPLSQIGPSEKILIHMMIETMYNCRGVGLAAPQVGINQRLFVIDAGDGPMAFINPEILKAKGEECFEEGCLSVPDVSIPVRRSKKILVKYQDKEGRAHEEWLDGLNARVFLHEFDHLEGKLILDYASKEELSKFQTQLDKIHTKTKKN